MNQPSIQTIDIEIDAGSIGAGTLALTGSGEYLADMQPLDRYLIGLLEQPVKVVCLPTGAGTEGAERIAYWADLGESHFRRLGVEVHSLGVIDRATAMDENMAAQVASANFVYLSGGKPWYLYATLADTPVWNAITGVLQRGAVVAGCSAGAMIFGKGIPGKGMFGARTAGFGFLPNSMILPHYDEVPKALRRSFRLIAGSLDVVGIEGYTGLICRRDGCQVVGKGKVEVIRAGV
jgi:cyanophycinase